VKGPPLAKSGKGGRKKAERRSGGKKREKPREKGQKAEKGRGKKEQKGRRGYERKGGGVTREREQVTRGGSYETEKMLGEECKRKRKIKRLQK
jgi:hypothetical protein